VVCGDARGKRHETQGESVISESLIAAATEVLCAFDYWSSQHPPGGYRYAAYVPDVQIEFNTQDHADRGEQLVWAILAGTQTEHDYFLLFRTANQDEIQKLADFVEEFGQRLNMGSAGLDLQKSLQQRITQKRAEYVELLSAFNSQIAYQSWSDVSATAGTLQRLIDDFETLRDEVSDIAIQSARSQNMPQEPVPRWPLRSDWFGPVYRPDSCLLDVTISTFFNEALMDICRTIAAINHPGSQYAPETDKIALAAKFDELFNRCGLLSYHSRDTRFHNEAHAERLWGLEFNDFIEKTKKFLPLFLRESAADTSEGASCSLAPPQSPAIGGSTSPATVPAGGQSKAEPLPADQLERLEAVAKRIEGASEKMRSEADDTVSKVGAVTVQLAEAAHPFREMYKDERLAGAKADALKAGIPELVVDTIVSHYHAKKLPTTDGLLKYLNDSGFTAKLESEGHGTSRATVGRWLRGFKRIMVWRGFSVKSRLRTPAPASEPPEPQPVQRNEDDPESDGPGEENNLSADEKTGRTSHDAGAHELLD
jgi:hypothetical protein